MLNINNLSIKKGDFLLEGLDLSLSHSKIHILLGSSGSGKTLLLETILGINPVIKGSIDLNNINLNNLAIENRSISYVPQDLCLFPHLNVKENILFSSKFITSDINQNRFKKLCTILEISTLLDRPIQYLSGGEKQRVAIARALMIDKDLLILDEPFSSLHQKLRSELWLQLRQIQEEFKLCIFMVTHDLNEALFLADYLYLIMDQKIYSLSKESKKLNYPKNKKALEFLGVKNFINVKKLVDSNILSKKNELDLDCYEIAFASNNFKVCSNANSDQILFKGQVVNIFLSIQGYILQVKLVNFDNIFEIFITKNEIFENDLKLNDSLSFVVNYRDFIYT